MRWKNVLLVLAAVLAINLPALHGVVQHQRVSSSGVDVRARVVQERAVGGDSYIAFVVPAGSPEHGDPSFRGTAKVDPRTYAAAADTGTVSVRVLPGSTSAWRVAGQITSPAGLVITAVADLLILAFVLLYLRFRHRLRAELVLVADEDLEACAAPATTLERLQGQRYVVSGVVRTREDDAVLLDVGGRRVRVLLNGHAGPTGQPEAVSAVGTMIA